jgi:primosomal protein N' (replication factor Y)
MLTDNTLVAHPPNQSSAEASMPLPEPPPDPERGRKTANPGRSHSGSGQQGELFETEPPPWELAVDDDVAVASVVFSEAPHGPYDYRIPDQIRGDLQPGMRVLVPLGRRRRPIAGWCIETKLGSSSQRTLREVAEVLDDMPLCDPPLVRLVMWMSHYYQAPT